MKHAPCQPSPAAGGGVEMVALPDVRGPSVRIPPSRNVL